MTFVISAFRVYRLPAYFPIDGRIITRAPNRLLCGFGQLVSAVIMRYEFRYYVAVLIAHNVICRVDQGVNLMDSKVKREKYHVIIFNNNRKALYRENFLLEFILKIMIV